ncbi:MAG TPA: MFS transporter, partial [Gemmatimonadaceae bacterium]|nr:MFS transporter [Gemmatimonadaceae bacterium]
MIVLDSTVMSVAFPTLQRTFAVGPDAVQWVLSVYVLALGVATPVAGSVADRFGIKRVYIGALCTFVLGSIMSGLAPSLGALIASRAVQGIGG